MSDINDLAQTKLLQYGADVRNVLRTEMRLEQLWAKQGVANEEVRAQVLAFEKATKFAQELNTQYICAVGNTTYSDTLLAKYDAAVKYAASVQRAVEMADQEESAVRVEIAKAQNTLDAYRKWAAEAHEEYLMAEKEELE